MKEKSWFAASDKVRFRILGNLGSAHHNLGEYVKAAHYFLEAYPYNPEQPISYANKIAGVCTENFVRIDLVTESPNVGDDGRAVMLLPDAVRLPVQVEEPT